MSRPARLTLTLRHATQPDIRDIVSVSRRVQDALSESGSLQRIGPLEYTEVSDAIESQGFYVATHSTLGHEEIVGCARVRSIQADFLPQNRDFDIARFPKPWRYLSSFMLIPELQGKGYGYKMFSDLVDFVEGAGGHGSMFLDCWSGNTKLREFYEGCGLLDMGTVPEEDFLVNVYFRSIGPPPAPRPDAAG